MKRIAILLFVGTAACYRSHDDAVAHDAGAPDAGRACTVSVTPRAGVPFECTIPAGSTSGCTDAALCACAAQGHTGTDLVRCAGWELVPRGAITFADFCSEVPPPRTDLAMALDGYFASTGADVVTLGPECAAMPALIGPEPYAECGLLASQICTCMPEPCDLDAMLGRACLAMERERISCVQRRLSSNDPCGMDVRALVAGCL